MTDADSPIADQHRVVAFLRSWDWKHIFIELVVVVLGVMLGMEVSNWNEERREQQRFEKLVGELGPGLEAQLDASRYFNEYFATTDSYAEIALRGWENDPGVTDAQFVTAAYQASQIRARSMNDNAIAAVFGGPRALDIDNDNLRGALIAYTTRDNESLKFDSVVTAYRENVRRVLREDIQRAIREQCGDRPHPEQPRATYLPPDCVVKAPAAEIAAAASALRARPQLVEDLRWHLSQTEVYRINTALADRSAQQLVDAIAAMND